MVSQGGGGAYKKIRAPTLIAGGAVVTALVIVAIVFVISGTGASIGDHVDKRFLILANLLKALALIAVSLALVSIVAAGLLHPSRIRKKVRGEAQGLVGYAAETGVFRCTRERLLRSAGRAVLWLTNSSLRVQPFEGVVTGVDAASVSSALAGFLPEIGSPTRIGRLARSIRVWKQQRSPQPPSPKTSRRL